MTRLLPTQIVRLLYSQRQVKPVQCVPDETESIGHDWRVSIIKHKWYLGKKQLCYFMFWPKTCIWSVTRFRWGLKFFMYLRQENETRQDISLDKIIGLQVRQKASIVLIEGAILLTIEIKTCLSQLCCYGLCLVWCSCMHWLQCWFRFS